MTFGKKERGRFVPLRKHCGGWLVARVLDIRATQRADLVADAITSTSQIISASPFIPEIIENRIIFLHGFGHIMPKSGCKFEVGIFHNWR